MKIVRIVSLYFGKKCYLKSFNTKNYTIPRDNVRNESKYLSLFFVDT